MRSEQGPANGFRPSIEEKQAYYLHPDGEGYQRALAEAREILDAYGYEDAGYRDAADWTGFSVRQLRAAIPEPVNVDNAQVETVRAHVEHVHVGATAPVIGRDTPAQEMAA